MNKGGFIIRLIDITLIILFGFISISDIKVQGLIKLPQLVEGDDSQQQVIPLVIKIGRDHHFEYIENRKARPADSIVELETFFQESIARYRQERGNILVFIKPDVDSSVQITVDVIDLCRKYNLTKNLAFDYAALQL